MKKKESRGRWLTIVLFALCLCAMEILFLCATGCQMADGSAINIILFSIAYSMVFYLLSSLWKKTWLNRLIGALLLTGAGVLYVVQYLIFKQFKIFYDWNTMLGGATDALSSYTAETKSLLLEQGGIFTALLILLPVVVYVVASFWLIPSVRGNWKTRLTAGATGVLAYGLAMILVMSHPVHSLVYAEQYNFQTAVEQFGLMTSLMLDTRGGTQDDFQLQQDPLPELPTPTQPHSQDDEQAEETEPVVYGKNEMDLDFQKLNEGASASIRKINDYVSTLTPSGKNAYTGLFEGKNLIFITAEAFTAEVLDPELTPTLYRLATKGMQFTDYYQPTGAGTTGGEYQNIFGMLPSNGGMSFKNTANHLNYFTIGSQLDRLGYYGQAFHNNDYKYYDRHRTHINIGYSQGFMGYGNGMEEYVKPCSPQSDYEMFTGTVPTFIDQQPFNIYYMTVSGHSNYTPGSNDMTEKNWDRVQDLTCSAKVKGYIAANLELEDAMAYLVAELEKAGIADDTVICLTADHFPYGLDNNAYLGYMPLLSELYGYKVVDTFQRDHSSWIIWSGCLEDREPIVVDTPTSSLDILPTLSNLFGTEFDSRLMPGRDVFSDAQPLVFNAAYEWKTELGTYYATTGKFVPADDTVEIPEGYVEYMHTVVKNKINYCSLVLATDYFRHLFG